MDLYRFSVFAHIFLGILFTGLALYWIIMASSLPRLLGTVEGGRLLQVAHALRWPPAPVPKALRIPLPWLTWLLILGLWGTGIVNSKLRGMPEGPLWWAKMGLFVVIIGVQVVLTRNPRPAWIRANFVLALTMIVVSGWVIR
jgi:hypothetical protein